MNNTDKSELINRMYRQYSDLIYRYILLMIGDRKQAEDLVHETYIKAFKSCDSFEERSSDKTWLYTIARNITIDYLRKQKLRTLFPHLLDTNTPDSRPTPPEIIEYGELTEKLYKALSLMKPSYREVIILRRIKGLSIAETALILKWSESKVKSTLYRGLQALKNELDLEGIINETI